MNESFESVRELIRESSEAALGTVEGSQPFVSAVGFVSQQSEDIILDLLLSDLSRHTRNLQKNPSVSLLVVEEGKTIPVHEKVRATLLGKAELVKNQEKFQQLKKIYLKQFPKSEIFFSLPDFRFYEIKPQEIHWIGGFGKAQTFILAADKGNTRGNKLGATL